jgi:glycosyltransferase involved in cell wall biosynthesis
MPQAVAASVIVPAYRAAPHLALCVGSLLSQEFPRPFEVIVVVSGEADDDLGYAADLPTDPRLNLVVHRPRLSAAEGRNLGVERARSDQLVFTDADVVAESGWLATIVEATQARWCVAGAVLNGTPESRAGTTEYLLEFLDLHPRRPPGSAWHGATCNLAVPRALWEQFGPLVDVLPGDREVGSADTAFTLQLANAGQFTFCAAARIRHMNRTNLRAVLVHQRKLGQNVAALARNSSAFPYRNLVRRSWAAPLIVGARWLSLWRRLLSWRVGLAGSAATLTGHLALGLGAWGVGLFEANRAIERGGSMAKARQPLQ